MVNVAALWRHPIGILAAMPKSFRAIGSDLHDTVEVM